MVETASVSTSASLNEVKMKCVTHTHTHTNTHKDATKNAKGSHRIPKIQISVDVER